VNAFSQFIADHAAEPAVALLARTAGAMRTDAGFVERPGDPVAGALLSDETPAPLDPEALAAVMARIDQGAALDQAAADLAGLSPYAAEIAALPSPVREAGLAAVGRHRWRFGGFGIRRLPLMSGDGAFAELMRIEPGRGVPDHDHADDELTLILTGGYHDGRHHYGPGDISLARPGFTHEPKADPGAVCYVLALSYGAPLLSGAYRLLQPILAEPADAKAAWRTR